MFSHVQFYCYFDDSFPLSEMMMRDAMFFTRSSRSISIAAYRYFYCLNGIHKRDANVEYEVRRFPFSKHTLKTTMTIGRRVQNILGSLLRLCATLFCRVNSTPRGNKYPIDVWIFDTARKTSDMQTRKAVLLRSSWAEKTIILLLSLISSLTEMTNTSCTNSSSMILVRYLYDGN